MSVRLIQITKICSINRFTRFKRGRKGIQILIRLNEILNDIVAMSSATNDFK